MAGKAGLHGGDRWRWSSKNINRTYGRRGHNRRFRCALFSWGNRLLTVSGLRSWGYRRTAVRSALPTDASNSESSAVTECIQKCLYIAGRILVTSIMEKISLIFFKHVLSNGFLSFLCYFSLSCILTQVSCNQMLCFSVFLLDFNFSTSFGDLPWLSNFTVACCIVTDKEVIFQARFTNVKMIRHSQTLNVTIRD